MTDNTKLKNILLHVLAWIVYLAYEILATFTLRGIRSHLIEGMIFMFTYAAYFYSMVYLVLPSLKTKKYVNFISLALFSIFLLISLRYVVVSYVGPVVNPNTPYRFESLGRFLNETLWRGIYFTLLAIGFWNALNLIRSEREKRILEETKFEYEREMREKENKLKVAQLNFLKNQINPHFLFNTLNFLYEQSITSSKGTSEGIIALSEIMRYSLKDKEIDSKTMLTDEVKHIENFIKIHQLRFRNRIQVQFNIEGNLHFRMILPLILITFVENCFKYGELFDANHPVLINLCVDNNTLNFYTCNKKKLGPIETSTGIGIQNTKRRLELTYDDKFDLQYKEEDNFFRVWLTIQI
jgi:two-component system, LytTR family, sensor kinase